MMTKKVNAKMHRLITIDFILYGLNIDGQLGGIPEIEYFAVIYIKVNNHPSITFLPHNNKPYRNSIVISLLHVCDYQISTM